MTEETYKAMKKARTECRRAVSALLALLEHPFNGHTVDRCDAARQCCDAAIDLMTVDLDDHDWHKRMERRTCQEDT